MEHTYHPYKINILLFKNVKKNYTFVSFEYQHIEI